MGLMVRVFKHGNDEKVHLNIIISFELQCFWWLLNVYILLQSSYMSVDMLYSNKYNNIICVRGALIWQKAGGLNRLKAKNTRAGWI